MADEQPTSPPETAEDDARLMEKLSGGDMHALGELYRRHHEAVRRVAWHMTGRADLVDDICQETFLRVHRAAGSYRPTAAFRTWLYRVVVNLCLDWRRSAQPAQLTESQQFIQENPTHRGELAAAVRQAIDSLPPRQRVALILHRFEGMTYAQIAAATGWSESAVESLLVRAYQELRNRLREWST